MADESWGEIALKILDAVGFKKLLSGLLERKHYIIVIGSTGAGKTALVGALSSVEQQIINVLNRTERPSETQVKMEDIKTILVDTPGEIAKLTTRMSDIAKTFHKPRVGLLIVVSDGYHEYRASSKLDVSTPDGFKEYLDKHRKTEKEHLNSFVSQFPFADDVDWAITVATKSDLWWGEEARVLDQYSSEEFQSIVRRICRHGAPPRPFSSTTEPFMGTIPGHGAFGENKRREIRTSFLETLFAQMAGR